MAKLGKQKFSMTGEHNSARTTFSGTFELYLYYDSEGDYFYFDTKEMKQYLPEDTVSDYHKGVFSHCNTKQKAIDIIEVLISSQLKEKRKLRIVLGMPSEIYKVPNPKYKKSEPGSDIRTWRFEEQEITDPTLPKYLQEMLSGGVYRGSGLTLEFYRIMEVEVNGKKMYAGCDENWKYKRKDLSSHAANLIDWTPEAEQFLMNTQHTLDSLCKLVLNFFNAGDDVQNLLGKMHTKTNLLTDGSK